MTTSTPARPGRNEPCHCGSGRKYKQCCLEKDDKKAAKARAKAAAEAPEQPVESTESKTTRGTKPQTDQPWKTGSSTRGFVPRSRTPRKVGGG
jgi:SEC-C motif